MPSNNQNCAIFCSCSGRNLIPRDSLSAVRSELIAQGWQVHDVPDLCALASQEPVILREMAATPDLLVAACRPRAVRWLLYLAGVARPAADILFRDMRAATAAPNPTPDIPSTHQAASDVPPAWFPVIDYDRCTGCRQCVSFCAFGVYSLENGKVRVSAPSNCKDNCPACARICPALAIIFPKVGDSPINGDMITDVHLAASKAAIAAARRDATGGSLQDVLAARRARASSAAIHKPHPPPP